MIYGFGAAKNTEVSWDFPVNEMVEHVNVLAQRALQPVYHKYEKGIVSLDSKKFPKRGEIWSNQRRGERIGYLLPANINKDGVAIHIPSTFIYLSSCWIYFAISADHSPPPAVVDLDIDEIPPLTVNIQFEDIAGETHRKSYNLYLKVESVEPSPGSNLMKFGGQVTVRSQRERGARRKSVSRALNIVIVELKRVFTKAA
jgi:hypothetical protein